LAQRSRIVLAAADGASNQEIAARLKIPAVTVGKWRRLFAAHGIEGLRDAPRCGRPPKHDSSVRHRVQTRVCQQPEDQSRWSVRTLAAELGLPASTVHAMLVAAKLQPHRIRTFTFSPDPDFEAKLLDIVGLYLNPPDNALVLCVDEKPSIQALDRTQPLLPLQRKKAPRLDQRIRPSRHADAAGGLGDRNRQSGRSRPRLPDDSGLSEFHGRGGKVLSARRASRRTGQPEHPQE
jgi:transposase